MSARYCWVAFLLVSVPPAAMRAAERPPEFEDVIRHDAAGLCTEAAVRRELKVSDEQGAKIDAALRPIREGYEKALGRLGKVDTDEAKVALGKLAEETRSKAAEAAVGQLDEKQAARLRQIDLQERGPALAFEDEVVRKVLRFSDDQTKKLAALKIEYEVRMRRFKRESSGASTPKLIPDTDLPQAGQELLTCKTYPMLKKEYALAVKNVLTNEQRDRWYDLIGDIYPNPIPPKK